VKDERDYGEHILECIEAIQAYTSEGRPALDDGKTQDAVIRRLQVMAESTLRLSDARKDAYPQVGWQHIRNFRNRLVHEYLGVDIEVVWSIIQHNLPALKIAVEAMLRELEENEDDTGEGNDK
jgi:uncharacterized protein with HEPN domain